MLLNLIARSIAQWIQFTRGEKRKQNISTERIYLNSDAVERDK